MNPGRALAMLLLTGVACGPAIGAEVAGPTLRNPGFEEDAYTVSPGYARQNGGVIAGWTLTGGAGVNPVWRDPARKAATESPFHDNGKVPEGRQLAFIQGPGSLCQIVAGFRRGMRYRIVYRENARVQRRGEEWPSLRVLLGSEVVVSAHEVTPVGAAEATDVPFARVVSAWFVPTADGPLEVRFEAVQKSPTTTVLLDAVRLEEEAAP